MWLEFDAFLTIKRYEPRIFCLQIYTLVGVYIVLGLSSMLTVSFFLDPLPIYQHSQSHASKDDDQSDSTNGESKHNLSDEDSDQGKSWKADAVFYLTATFKHMLKRNQLLLTPSALLMGWLAAFTIFEYTKVRKLVKLLDVAP